MALLHIIYFYWHFKRGNYHALRGNAAINAPALTAYHLSLLFLCVDTTLVRLLLRYHAVRGNEVKI